jgi:hypothetical protein
MGLLSSGALIGLAGAGLSTGKTLNCGELIAATNHSPAPVVSFDHRPGDELPEELAELTDPTDDDESKASILCAGSGAFKRALGLHEQSANRAVLIPFWVLAFPSRGSPLA